MAAATVPLMALPLTTVVVSQLAEVGSRAVQLLPLVPLSGGFAVLTQTLVELAVMVVLVAAAPRLVLSPRHWDPAADRRRHPGERQRGSPCGVVVHRYEGARTRTVVGGTMTAMPTRAPHPRVTSRRWRTVIAVAVVAVLVAAVVLVTVRAFRAPAPATTDCARYGLASDDSRAHPHTVTRATQHTSEDQTQAGPLGRLDQSFTDRGVTSRYHLIDGGVDTSRPVGLVVDLHGDGGAEFYEPGGRSTCLAAVAASHNALLAVPLTPDSGGRCTWWEKLRPNMRWLRALTERELLRNSPVQRERVTWLGYSGGAEMLSYGVLRDARDLVTGGAVMVGGGGAPDALRAVPTDRQKRDTRMWWFTGADDDGTDPNSSFDAVSAATSGRDFYARQGFRSTRLEILPGHDHFDMPDAAILDELLTTQDGRAAVDR